eukprot:12309200-Heterocapsa_arctica.AAC.1
MKLAAESPVDRCDGLKKVLEKLKVDPKQVAKEIQQELENMDWEMIEVTEKAREEMLLVIPVYRNRREDR